MDKAEAARASSTRAASPLPLCGQRGASDIPAKIAAMFADCKNADEVLARLSFIAPEWQDAVLNVASGSKTESAPSKSYQVRERQVFYGRPHTQAPLWKETLTSPDSVSTREANDFTVFDYDPDGDTGIIPDEAYLQWVKNNDSGFVLNVERPVRPGSDVKLHKAECWSIKIDRFRPYVGINYIKVCSTSRSQLVQWASQQVRKLDECKACNP